LAGPAYSVIREAASAPTARAGASPAAGRRGRPRHRPDCRCRV